VTKGKSRCKKEKESTKKLFCFKFVKFFATLDWLASTGAVQATEIPSYGVLWNISHWIETQFTIPVHQWLLDNREKAL
jgi:hypothetical protein